MIERRRGQRVVLHHPGMATVRVTADVEVTHLDRAEVTVITRWPLPAGERLRLEIPDDQCGVSYARLVRVVSRRLLLRDGRLHREVRLAIIGRPGEVADVGDRLDSSATRPTSAIGAIVRRLPVRLIEVSSSGCLCDTRVPLEEGSVGFVEVRTSDQCRTEGVRILRTFGADGPAWPYRMAVEFLTLGPLSPTSLRGIGTVVATGARSESHNDFSAETYDR